MKGCVIGGMKSGAGKTTAAVATMRLRKDAVQAFPCGPVALRGSR